MAGIRWKGLRESRHYRTTDLVRQPPAGGPKKPPMMKACNGCGVCCVAEPCAIAQALIPGMAGRKGPCPALEWENGRSWCGLVRRPLYYSQAARDQGINERECSELVQSMLGGMGAGCDSDPYGDPGAVDGMTAAEYLARS